MTAYATHHFEAASRYTVSVAYDRRLYAYDVAGSIAHARMLARQGVIAQADANAIADGLEAVRREIESGAFPWREEYEDLHMNIEARLRELIGEPAARLHAARSRNDQVATATRLYVRDAVDRAVRSLRALQGALIALAERDGDALMPGYTHLQRAQPVPFAHHLLAYVEMFDRDAARFADARKRVNVLPLGSGALAGVPYPVDREWTARELGFDAVSANSMDAVSDRDYAVEYLAAAAACMMHCSRLAEEIVLWSSQEFGFIQLGRQWVTGSSIMPQKRNPDFAEIARGKTGRVYGSLVGLLTTLKGLPLTYNRDLQEDKEGLFDAVDTLEATLEAMRGMLGDCAVNAERMREAAEDSALLATDLADYLVGKGVPFREAHAAVASLCGVASERGVPLTALPLEEMQALRPEFDADARNLTADASAAARDVPGGAAPARVRQALAAAKARLEAAGD